LDEAGPALAGGAAVVAAEPRGVVAADLTRLARGAVARDRRGGAAPAAAPPGPPRGGVGRAPGPRAGRGGRGPARVGAGVAGAPPLPRAPGPPKRMSALETPPHDAAASAAKTTPPSASARAKDRLLMQLKRTRPAPSVHENPARDALTGA